MTRLNQQMTLADGRIYLRAQPVDSQVQIQTQDTGEGIAVHL
jgi:hypothetical protein